MNRVRLRDMAYLLVFACLAGLVVARWHELAELWRQHGITFVGAVLLMALAMIIQARNFAAFLDVRTDIDLLRFSGIWGATALLNYAGPFQPGVLARVVYLRTKGVDAIASVLATLRQLSASVWIALGGMGLGMFAMGDARMHWPALALLVIFIGIFAAWCWRAHLLATLTRILRLQRYLELMQRALAGMTLRGVLGVAIQYLIGMLVLLWVYPRFGADMGAGEALILTCMVYVSTLIAVLPANVGVLEGIYALGGHQLGLGLPEAVALALLLRASHVTACLLLLPLARRSTAPAS